MKNERTAEARKNREAEDLREAHSRVMDRMGCYPETLEEAVEKVYEDFEGGLKFRAKLIAYTQGKL